MQTFTNEQLHELMVLIHKSINTLIPDGERGQHRVKRHYRRSATKRDTMSHIAQWHQEISYG